MKISSNCNSGYSIHDLPPGLFGVHGTDVVLPTGHSVYLQGASREANVHLQYEIEEITRGAPVPMSPALILRVATDQYCRRLMETSETAV